MCISVAITQKKKNTRQALQYSKRVHLFKVCNKKNCMASLPLFRFWMGTQQRTCAGGSMNLFQLQERTDNTRFSPRRHTKHAHHTTYNTRKLCASSQSAVLWGTTLEQVRQSVDCFFPSHIWRTPHIIYYAHTHKKRGGVTKALSQLLETTSIN